MAAGGVEGEGLGMVALAGLQDGTVVVVDLSGRGTGVGEGVLRTCKVGWSGVEAVACDEETGWLAAGTRNGTVALFALGEAPPGAADSAAPLAPVLSFARGSASITSLAFSPFAALAETVAESAGRGPTLLVGTSDGLPFRVAIEGGAGEGLTGVRVAEEFAGVECDRTVVVASGREVWVGAADGKLRRYLS